MAFGISAGAAALIGGGLGAAGSVGGAMIGSNAANSAAAQQAQAAQQANALQENIWRTQQQNAQPYMQAGQTALSQMRDPSFNKSFSMADFQQDPGYAFRMQQGQQALERSAAARGGIDSGAQLKALTQYGQDYGSNEYQNAFNRFQTDQSNRFGRLSSIAGMGQNAVAGVGQAGQAYAGNVGNNLTGAASAQGAAGIAGANAISSGLSGIGKSFNDTMASGQQYNQQQLQNEWMNKWLSNQTPKTPVAPPPSNGGYTLGINYNF